MEKISFYGLSRSGKSCYIFAMAQSMSQGLRFPDGRILTVISPIPMQMARLYKAYAQMAEGKWPAGNVESVNYNFNAKIALEKLMSFSLKDYRGGLLDTCDEDEMEEQEELFDSFKDSTVLLFFVGADVVGKAMKGDYDSSFKLSFFSSLYENYADRTGDAKTPIMIVITKSDLLSQSELQKAKEYVKSVLQSMFGKGTNITVALTAVTLGRNLSNDNGELEGELIIGQKSGNIHIPILYSLFCVISENIEHSIGVISSQELSLGSSHTELVKEQSRSALARFFSSKENTIKSKIESSNRVISEEKKKLLRMNDLLNLVKPLLLEGAEVYVNGDRKY